MTVDRWAWLVSFGLMGTLPARGQDAPRPDPVVSELVAAHNRERAEAKLPPLALAPKLEVAARAHAQDMADHEMMAHEGSDGSTPAERVKKAGYHYQKTGENVARGYPDVEAVIRGWMESPHHKENILGDFTEIGVARALGKDGEPYWCANFGRPIPQLDPARATSDLVERLNQERTKAERPPFAIDPKLSEKAQAIATAQAKEKDKAPPPSFEGIDAKAYRKLGMSVANGQPTAEALAKSLIESPDQKENLLGDFTRIGVGYATAEDGTPSWCLILGVPASGK